MATATKRFTFFVVALFIFFYLFLAPVLANQPRQGPHGKATVDPIKKLITTHRRIEFLSAHNMVRTSVGLPPMAWNYTLAYFAKQWALKRRGDCKLIHSYGPYGENLFWGSSMHWSPTDVVKSWVNEKIHYDPRSNSCKQNQMCGHYTQVVWKETIKVGCARVKCFNGKGVFVICNYDPPGNYVNERPFGNNLR